MAVDVFLNFEGNCREAVEYYAQIFKTDKPKFMTYGEAPKNDFPMDEKEKDFIIYTELRINGSNIMFSDAPLAMQLIKGNNFGLTIGTTDKDEITRLFNELKDGGEVQMELQKTFWSELYGMVTDKFGITWQLSHDSGIVY